MPPQDTASPESSPIGKAALDYASRGWPVFPVRPQDKKPATRHGFKDASTDPSQVSAWWGQIPAANVGVATGRESGLVVLDVDPGHGGTESLRVLEALNGALPPTVAAKSGGGGRHYYFKAPASELRCSAGQLGAGLDVRGNGGYIVAPPSVHSSGARYEWLPGLDPGSIPLADIPTWLLGKLEARPKPACTAPINEGIPEGQRNETLASIAGGLRSRGMGLERLRVALHAINESSCQPPLPAQEVESIAASISRYPAVPLRSRSFASVCEIFRNGELRRKVMQEELEYDAFSCTPTLNRRPIQDHDVDRLRDRIESTFKFTDGFKKERGLQFTHDDVGRALHVVARDRPFHAVREYLRSLTWDGIPRLARELPRWLRLRDDPFVGTLVRRWAISAVARALRPGCKVDSVLTLVGAQGTFKSAFFATMGGPWTSDSPVDVKSKDAFLTLRSVWILECAELESLARARDPNAVKAFLSSQTDVYRPPYGHHVVEVPRSCVVVATTNDEGFLTDPTGNRRFWPVRVHGRIDLDSVRKFRDQLWAEAVAAFDAGERWHLAPDEESELAERHREFESTDPWEDAVLAHAARQRDGFPVTFILKCIGVDVSRQTKGDEMRVASILKRAGFTKRKCHGARLWVAPRSGQPGQPLDATPSSPNHGFRDSLTEVAPVAPADAESAPDTDLTAPVLE